MTARRLTFQLTPLLDLLLIVIFAQFMDVRDTTEHQEQTSSEQARRLAADRDGTASELAALQTEYSLLENQLDASRQKLAQAELKVQSLAVRSFVMQEELDRVSAERKAIAGLYSRLFNLPDDVVQQLFAGENRRLSAADIEKLLNRFQSLADQSPGQSVRHLLTVDEMWKRCDVWNLHIKPSGLTVLQIAGKSHQFEAATAQEFEEELYDVYTQVSAHKTLVILLLSYGNIDANVYEAAVDGLPRAVERMRSDSGGRSRFESAVIGFSAAPPPLQR